jgi:hypothetical protein
MLQTYAEFVDCLENIGFMTLSPTPLGYPSLSDMTAEEQWHTGLQSDPWQWKTRIVDDKKAAYAKVFHKQPSFINEQWYPCILAARRGQHSFEDMYDMGLMSGEAKRINELFYGRDVLALHEIKRLGGFAGKSKGRFESAMTSLQAGMFITISGMTRMTTLDGRPHSWPVTEYMRVERWAWEGTLEQAAKLSPAIARAKISEKILEWNPSANINAIATFLGK